MRLVIAAGIIAMAAGAAGVAYVQLGVPDPARITELLQPGQSVELQSVLSGPDTGFFSVVLEAPRAAARILIVSPTGEELAGGVYSTIKSVDYFMLDKNGTHTIRATLVSSQATPVSLELGQMGSAQTMYPAVVLVAGVVIIVVALCVMLVRYITAQPDENTL